MIKIFISHAGEDNEIVKKIIATLEKYQIEYWVDIKQLKGEGHAINSEINNGVKTSTHFLLVWSKNAANSRFVEQEYNAAISPDYKDLLTKIIFRLDEETLPFLLSDINYHRVNSENVEEITRQTIRNILEKDEDYQKDFETSLDEDENNVEVKIDDTFYRYSKALKAVDPAKYKTKYENWIDGELEGRKKDSIQSQKGEN